MCLYDFNPKKEVYGRVGMVGSEMCILDKRELVDKFLASFVGSEV